MCTRSGVVLAQVLGGDGCGSSSAGSGAKKNDGFGLISLLDGDEGPSLRFSARSMGWRAGNREGQWLSSFILVSTISFPE